MANSEDADEMLQKSGISSGPVQFAKIIHMDCVTYISSYVEISTCDP